MAGVVGTFVVDLLVGATDHGPPTWEPSGRTVEEVGPTRDLSFDESNRLLARYAQTLTSLDGRRPQSWRLCEAVRRVVGGDGVVATVGYLSDIRTTLCATDDLAAAVEGLQELVGQGPGYDAAISGHLVTCYLGDVRHSRWTQLAQAMWDELWDVTVFAIPIRPRAGLTGVVTLYTSHRRPLGVSGESASLLVQGVGGALFAEGGEQQASAEGLREPWTSRIVVHQATGMVMAQLGISADDALSLLRSRAYASEADVATVARQVVDRKLSFADATAGGD